MSRSVFQAIFLWRSAQQLLTGRFMPFSIPSSLPSWCCELDEERGVALVGTAAAKARLYGPGRETRERRMAQRHNVVVVVVAPPPPPRNIDCVEMSPASQLKFMAEGQGTLPANERSYPSLARAIPAGPSILFKLNLGRYQ